MFKYKITCNSLVNYDFFWILYKNQFPVICYFLNLDVPAVRSGWGYSKLGNPSPPKDLLHTAGGMPLAFKQEDFVVFVF